MDSPEQAEQKEHGPHDSREYGERGALLDAGSLWLPAVPGAALHFTMNKSTHAVMAAVYTIGDSAMQLQPYAAPRSRGLWDQLRLDMRTSIAEQGGLSEEVDGEFGTALVARVPSDGEVSRKFGDGAPQYRFIGIDGPRWFLKVSLSGSAAAHESQREPFMAVLRRVVVHRGDEPRPPKELLDLRLPANPAGQDKA